MRPSSEDVGDECHLGAACPTVGHQLDGLVRLPRQSLTWAECFLCGNTLTESTRSYEHVFPKWLLQRHNLWDQRLTLPNRTLIPYRQLTIPCCTTCNTGPLSGLEDSVANAFADGYDGVAALNPHRLGLWLAKLHYGMLFRDLTLAWSRREQAHGNIVSEEWLQTYRVQHVLLQAIRGEVATPSESPFSVLLYRCQTGEPAERTFDYRDSLSFPFAALRSREVGLVGVLQDWGELRRRAHDVVSLDAACQLTLHPEQFAEVVATARYMASLMRHRTHVVLLQPPGGPISIQPLNLPSSCEDPYAFPSLSDFAGVLACELDVPLSTVTDERGHVTSRLRDSDGTPILMQWDQTSIRGDHGSY